MSMEDITKNLTDAQIKTLKKFKEKLDDVLTPAYTDATLVKWLRARNFDIKGAEKIFRENYNNRILFGVNTMIDTYDKPEVAKKYETLGVLGFAKDGSLIRYTGAGRLDFYGFIMSMSCVDLCLYFSYMMECDIQASEEESQRTGRKIDEITYILDLEGFHIQQILHKNVIEMGLDFTRLIQDCYPEIWRRILVVNAPAIFDKAYHIFKPVLRSHVLDKMKVVNKDSTKDVLLKYIDEDVLPEFLGGKRVDSNGDPMCKEFITFGGKVPEKFYGQNHSAAALLSPGDPGVKCFVIGPRSVYNELVAIKDGGTVIKMLLRSENGSVTISVLYRKFQEGEDSINAEFPGQNEYLDDYDENCRYKMITVCMRAQIHCCPEVMEGFLERPGVYAIRFSNAGNWFTSRKVLMSYTLHPPKSSSTTQQE